MEIIVEKSELLKELSITQGVVERKSTVPILSNFLFETAHNNFLIAATDLDVSLRTFCPAAVNKQGSCTVPARKLYDYVRLLPDGEVTIRLAGPLLNFTSRSRSQFLQITATLCTTTLRTTTARRLP